jgi:low temperature requirement protein LtrA
MLMMYGVVALAAGTKLSVEDLAGPAPVFNAWLIAAGGALFLLGAAGFRIALGFGSPWPRIAGAIACLGAATIGARASVAAELASVAAAIGVTLAIEGRLERSVVTR